MWTKLKAILWKNLRILNRHRILTVTGILLPILSFVLLIVSCKWSNINGINKTEINATYSEVLEDKKIIDDLPERFQLWYTPYTDLTDPIITKVREKLKIGKEAIRHFNSEQELHKHFPKNSNITTAAVVFRGTDPKKLHYNIIFNVKDLLWDIDKRFMIRNEEINGSLYLSSGFAALQIAINTVFLQMSVEKTHLNFKFSIQEFPYIPHTFDSELNQLFTHFLPLVTIFSFIFLCCTVVPLVAKEMQSGNKEYLKTIGVNSSIIWFGWIIHALMTSIISITAIVILMTVPFWDDSGPLIEHSNSPLLFLFLLLYYLATETFCFLIYTLINTPSIATIMTILISVLSFIIPQSIDAAKNMRWFGIFPNMALYYGYSQIALYERRDVGIQWYNIFTSGSGEENDVTMGNVLLFFVFQSVFFMLLTLYIENVKPGKYGIAKPLSFPFLHFLGLLKRLLKRIQRKMDPLPDEENVAVAGNNLNMSSCHKNCITVLLEHDAAKKTTSTMSLLTGKHTNEARKNLGLCIQDDLLINEMTASEHLEFFGKVKGKRSNKIESEVKELLEKFKINPNAIPQKLSGIMKRKLCLAIALIGGSEVLILDEPTSGMDPKWRLKVWNMLLEMKKSKTIVIITHSLEEANVLGDRIAVMTNGTLHYHETLLDKVEEFNIRYQFTLMLKSKAAPQEIEDVIKSKIPRAQVLSKNGNAVVCLIPFDEKKRYHDLFNKLEEDKDNLGIENMCLSVSTRNDGFSEVNDAINDGEVLSPVDSSIRKGGTTYVKSIYKHVFAKDTTKKLTRSKDKVNCQRNIFMALMLKRCSFFKMKFSSYLPAVIAAIIIFLVTTISLDHANTDLYGGPKLLNLALNIYGKPEVIYGGNIASSQLLSEMKQYYRTAVQNEEGKPDEVEDVSSEIIKKEIENSVYFKRHTITAAEFNTTTDDNEIIVNAMYSSNALHSLPISINLAMNAVLKSFLNDSFSISVANAPLQSHHAPLELSEIDIGILWLILVPIGLLFLVSNFLIFPNRDSSTNFEQNLVGVQVCVYWIGNVLFDFVLYTLKLFILSIAVALMYLLVFDPVWFGIPEIRAVFAIFACYGFVSLPFIYLFSHRSTKSEACTQFIMFCLFTGIAPAAAIRAVELFDYDHSIKIAEILKHFFLCSCPQFGLSYASVKFAQKYVQNFNWMHMNPNKKEQICEVDPNPCCRGDGTLECAVYQNYFYNETLGISNDLLEMLVPFFFYIVMLCFISTTLYQRILRWLRQINCSLFCNGSNESSYNMEENEPLYYAGTLPQLKNSYSIDIKLKQAVSDKAALTENLRSEIEELTNAKCTSKDTYSSDLLKYRVDETITLTKLFTATEGFLKKYDSLIDDYFINKISLANN